MSPPPIIYCLQPLRTALRLYRWSRPYNAGSLVRTQYRSPSESAPISAGLTFESVLNSFEFCFSQSRMSEEIAVSGVM